MSNTTKDTTSSSYQSAFEKAIGILNPIATKTIEIECELCERIFTQNSHFKRHLCNQKPRPVACEVCHKKFLSKSRLERHWRVHSGERPFECHICKKRFPYKNYMARHLLIHSDDKPFKCNVCDKSYVQLYKLKQHMYNHTGEKPHKCEYCGKDFTALWNLKVHLTTHESSKSHECVHCPKVCSTKYNLMAHMAIHKDDKPFKCETCGKCFVLKSSLEKHSNAHLRKKSFKCGQCPKSFSRKDYLFVHIKYTHNNQSRIFEKCQVCGKQFMFKSRLGKHMKVHTRRECVFCCRSTEECVCSKNQEGDDPMNSLKDPLTRDYFMFKCQTCFRIILRQSQLKIHLKIHRDYKCVVCDEDYRRCRCFDNHMEVSRSKNTYKKSTNISSSSSRQSSANSDETVGPVDTVKVKKEGEVDGESLEKKTIELLSEIVDLKEEPKEEYVEFNHQKAFADFTTEFHEDVKALDVKEESHN